MKNTHANTHAEAQNMTRKNTTEHAALTMGGEAPGDTPVVFPLSWLESVNDTTTDPTTLRFYEHLFRVMVSETPEYWGGSWTLPVVSLPSRGGDE
jgi:hypothetical protein